jgi:hypothetical protein
VQGDQDLLASGEEGVAWVGQRPGWLLWLKRLKEFLERQTEEAAEQQPVMSLGQDLIALPATDTLGRDPHRFCHRLLGEMAVPSLLLQTGSKPH